MLLTVLLAAIQMLTASPALPPASQPQPMPYVGGVGAGAKCPHATVRQANQGGPPPVQRFNELPAGRLELAVLRQVDGCPIPAVLQEGIGSGPPPVRR
jgi:hypothetical protein